MTGLVILEGPDACGKTTLARHLIERHGGKYIHLKLHKNLRYRQLASLVAAQLRYRDQLVIIDRHWVSEQVYGAIYRKYVLTDPESWLWLELIASMRGVYVMSTPPAEEAYAWFVESKTKRSEFYEVDERIKTVAECYRRFTFGNISSPHALIPTSLGGRIAEHGGLYHLSHQFPSILKVVYHHRGHGLEGMVAASQHIEDGLSASWRFDTARRREELQQLATLLGRT